MDISTLATALGGSALISAAIAFAIKSVGPKVVAEAGTLEHMAFSYLEAAPIPAAFKSLIDTELHSLSSDPTAVGDTVETASAKILAKVAPTFPAATITDVAQVVGQSAMAFVAGLAADTAPVTNPVAAVAAAK